MASSAGAGQEISLASLSVQQLSQLKKQLDEEITHLSTSFQSLRAAQAKFRDCLRTLAEDGPLSRPEGASSDQPDGEAGQAQAEGRHILVPLTSSLYVPGRLAPPGTPVLIDVGTGFFVEKSLPDGRDFYRAKVAALDANLKDLEKVMTGKGQNLAVVEDAIRKKVMAGSGAGAAPASATASAAA